MIAAVSTVRNEADIIEWSIRHLLAEGVDLVLVADGRSVDGTRDILADLEETGCVAWFDDDLPYHDQKYWIDRLAADATLNHGADWVIPFDADEFWIASNRGDATLAETIARAPGCKLYAPMWQHHDWDNRELQCKTFPKVAYRWNQGTRIRAGNHEVDGVPGGSWGVIEVREIQYRSFPHFVRKMRERNATIDPTLPADAGWHHKRLADFTEKELFDEWTRMCQVPTTFDPIPTRMSAHPSL